MHRQGVSNILPAPNSCAKRERMTRAPIWQDEKVRGESAVRVRAHVILDVFDALADVGLDLHQLLRPRGVADASNTRRGPVDSEVFPRQGGALCHRHTKREREPTESAMGGGPSQGTRGTSFTCLTSTGPISLKTCASSSRISSSWQGRGGAAQLRFTARGRGAATALHARHRQTRRVRTLRTISFSRICVPAEEMLLCTLPISFWIVR
mmetsp:Transcript_51853/g.152941  ORF Transcript_51853/g.152941 Transcript_51853/m.152941 type:complete len:209 (+) Transcript_51853:274-900(+)